jgi:hypothetical protein
VLVLIPCPQVGGTEIAALDVCRALRGCGMRVVVCAYHERSEAMVSQFRAAQTEVRCLDVPRPEGSWLARSVRLFCAPRHAIADTAPDLIHLEYMTPTLSLLLAARLSSGPALATTHLPGDHWGVWVGSSCVSGRGCCAEPSSACGNTCSGCSSGRRLSTRGSDSLLAGACTPSRTGYPWRRALVKMRRLCAGGTA